MSKQNNGGYLELTKMIIVTFIIIKLINFALGGAENVANDKSLLNDLSNRIISTVIK